MIINFFGPLYIVFETPCMNDVQFHFLFLMHKKWNFINKSLIFLLIIIQIFWMLNLINYICVFQLYSKENIQVIKVVSWYNKNYCKIYEILTKCGNTLLGCYPRINWVQKGGGVGHGYNTEFNILVLCTVSLRKNICTKNCICHF